MERMKKGFTQTAWIFLVICLSFGLFGCGKNSETEGQDTKETEKTTEEGNTGDEKDTDGKKETGSEEDTDGLSSDTVMMAVGKMNIPYKEVCFYLYQLKQKYEETLGSDIWNAEIKEGQTFGEYAKEEVISQLTELKIICQQAEQEGVVLTEDELSEIENEAENYMTDIKEEGKVTFQITKELVEQVYKDNVLANKMFDVTTSEVDTDISEEEAKQMSVQYITVLTNGTGKDGIEVNLTDKEKEDAAKRAKKLLKQWEKEEDLYHYAEANSDIKDISVTFGAEDKPAEFGEQAFALKTGSFSDVIEGKSGYYLVYCENDSDEDATMEKKEEIIREHQDEVFQKAYTEWSKKYRVVVSTTLWDEVTFK